MTAGKLNFLIYYLNLNIDYLLYIKYNKNKPE